MTYEYVCTACTHAWEAEQRITDAPVHECPACKQKAAKRLIASRGAFVLNGRGWARDGYAGSSC